RRLSLPWARPIHPRGNRRLGPRACLGAGRWSHADLIPLDGGLGRAVRDFCGLQRGYHRAHRAAGSKVGYESGAMPKVVFVNEHRIVEVPSGKNLKTLALELGINPHREFFRGVNCGFFGLCGTCQVWVRESSAGSTNAKNMREKMAGMR